MNCPICSEPLFENWVPEDIEDAVAALDFEELGIIADSPPYLCEIDSRSFWPSELDGETIDPVEEAKAHVAMIREMLGENSPRLPRRMIELG